MSADAATPSGWRPAQCLVVGARAFHGVMPRASGLYVIVDETEIDGKPWRHVSFSRRSRMPDYHDMSLVRGSFLDPDVVALQIFPKRVEHVNLHEYCLHLWQPIGFDPVPDIQGRRRLAVGGA